MTREEFMDLVYDELHSDGDNNRANRIIDAADCYKESNMEGRHEKTFNDGATRLVNGGFSYEVTKIAYIGSIAQSLACIADALEAMAAKSNEAADPLKKIWEEFNEACEREKREKRGVTE